MRIFRIGGFLYEQTVRWHTKGKTGGIMIENSVAYFYPLAFEDLCKAEGFSKKSFLSWADRKNLILTEGSRTTKVKKIAGKNFRCVALKLEPIDDDGFLKVEEPLDDLPFT